MKTRTYQNLIQMSTFEERYNYLKLDGIVGAPTFGSHRWVCQDFYKHDKKWLSIRDAVITRDNGCDLGIDGLEIFDHITIHHINPITVDDIIYKRNCIYDLDNLICTSTSTHRSIHYGSNAPIYNPLNERKPGDTTLWKTAF